MCIPNVEYQYVNPTTQVAMFSTCIGHCSTIENITWNIYQRSMNSNSSISKWTLFNQANACSDICFFGIAVDIDLWLFFMSSLGTNTSNFTARNDVFLAHRHVIYWRFEVVYSFASESSSSALNFIVNQPPQNGSCSINPTHGTTTTVFTISCPNWIDQDGIQDYAFYGTIFLLLQISILSIVSLIRMDK